MSKPKHIILKKEKNLTLFNKTKAKVISKNPKIFNLFDEDILETVMQFYLDKNGEK